MQHGTYYPENLGPEAFRIFGFSEFWVRIEENKHVNSTIENVYQHFLYLKMLEVEQ
jgi:hypothetical protein